MSAPFEDIEKTENITVDICMGIDQMSYASCKLANHLHFLGMLKMELQLLVLAASVIEVHLAKMMHKLELKSITELTAHAILSAQQTI